MAGAHLRNNLVQVRAVQRPQHLAEETIQRCQIQDETIGIQRSPHFTVTTQSWGWVIR